MDTHYLPEAPVFRGKTPRRQRAVCGVIIDATEHTNTPTCPVCKAYVESDIMTKAADELF
jgi:hypothetical protein